jgi:hypothetical protein
MTHGQLQQHRISLCPEPQRHCVIFIFVICKGAKTHDHFWGEGEEYSLESIGRLLPQCRLLCSFYFRTMQSMRYKCVLLTTERKKQHHLFALDRYKIAMKHVNANDNWNQMQAKTFFMIFYHCAPKMKEKNAMTKKSNATPTLTLRSSDHDCSSNQQN